MHTILLEILLHIHLILTRKYYIIGGTKDSVRQKIYYEFFTWKTLREEN